MLIQVGFESSKKSPSLCISPPSCGCCATDCTETNSGLGDRFLRYALLVTLALDRQLTPIYEPGGLLSEATDGAHGSYSWAQAFFNWGEGMLRLSDIDQREKFKMERVPFQVRVLRPCVLPMIKCPGSLHHLTSSMTIAETSHQIGPASQSRLLWRITRIPWRRRRMSSPSAT